MYIISPFKCSLWPTSIAIPSIYARFEQDSGNVLDSPKSQTLTLQFYWIKIFAGFRSRCITLHIWIKANEHKVLYKSLVKWFSLKSILCLSNESKSVSMNSITRQIFIKSNFAISAFFFSILIILESFESVPANLFIDYFMRPSFITTSASSFFGTMIS